ncbi:MAG: hypothetical protein ACPMAQ_10465 [Phycisphaerae bacterium]|jgi:hypothetical protein
MKWLRLKRSLLALLCAGFLFDAGCPDEKAVQTAASNAGQSFVNELVKGTVKKWFDYAVGLQ